MYAEIGKLNKIKEYEMSEHVARMRDRRNNNFQSEDLKTENNLETWRIQEI